MIEMGAHHHNLPRPIRVIPPENPSYIHVDQWLKDLDPLESLGRSQDGTFSTPFIPDPDQLNRL
jgi:hypothetical protein